MPELELKKIAEEEGATLIINDGKIDTGTGFYIADLNYLLVVKYKQKTINISIKTSPSTVGKVSCDICNPKKYLEFKMTTRSHFENLFFRKDRFKLISRNPNIDVFFKNSIGMAELKEITKSTAFEPIILGVNTEESYKLIIEYSLKFSDWHQVVKPIILFCKEFIDKFGGISMRETDL